MRDTGRGGGQSAPGAAVITQDLVGLEPGQGVFGAGPDPAVVGVVGLLPGGEFAAVAGFTVRHDHLGVAAVTAVGHHLATCQLVLHPAAAVDHGVVAVARLRVADGDYEAGGGVDGDLQVGRVAVVLRPRGEAVIPGGDQGAVDDGDLLPRPAPHRGQRQQRTEGVQDAVHAPSA